MKLPPGKVGIKSRVVNNEKADGTLKCRMVPKGFMQTDGVNYDSSHIDAPVIDKTLIRSMIAIGNMHKAKMRECDVYMAFLNAVLEEEVYMYPPPGIDIGVDDEGNPLVFRLLRAVYGLKQSPAAWNDLIDDWLKTKAPGPLTQSPYDRCFFAGWRGDDYLMLGFHVDDFLIVTTSDVWEKEFMTAISTRFEVKDLGALGQDTKSLLGLHVTRSITDTEAVVTISTPKTLTSLLKTTDMLNVHATTSPAREPPKSDLVSADPSDYKQKSWDPPAVVGSVQWCAGMCRPDLSVISSILGSERHDPTVAGMNNMERMLSYISGTIDMGLTYRHVIADSRKGKRDRRLIELIMYADSDWSGDLKLAKNPKCRSRSGILIMIDGKHAVYWQSKLRSTVDLSSSSAEIGTLSEACRRFIWLKRTLEGVGFIIGTVTTYEDNVAAIKQAEGQTLTERTRHLHLRDMYVRELIRSKDIKLEYIKSCDNLADFFTKILPVSIFRIQRDLIMGIVD